MGKQIHAMVPMYSAYYLREYLPSADLSNPVKNRVSDWQTENYLSEFVNAELAEPLSRDPGRGVLGERIVA